MATAEPEPINRDERLGEAIEEYLELAESGSAPDASEFVNRFPEIATELREALDGLALVQGLVGDSGGGARPLETGRRVAGYRIVRELGRGGMAVVYEAVHVDLDRPVALKVLGSSATPDSTGRRRFLNEAKTAASLHHTHIVPVFDVGQVGGLCYYAMQRIEGAGLDRVVKAMRRDRPTGAGHSSSARRRRWKTPIQPTPNTADPHAVSIECLPVDRSDCTASFHDLSEDLHVQRPLRIGQRAPVTSPYTPPRGMAYYRWVAQVGHQAADALAYAHRRGVVHRDIKPSNLLIDGRGGIWVADFGLARRIEDDPGLTHSGVPVGTPRYMSPEQASTAPLDARTDVYSLGATLYELLTLRPPFDGRTTPELIQQISVKEPTSPRKIDARIPIDLETLVLKAMAKRPGDRYATAQELADDLDRFLNLEPVRARRIGPAGRFWRFTRRHPYSSAISAIAASLVLAVATWAHLSVLRQRNDALAAQAATQSALIEAEQAKRQAMVATAETLWRSATVTRQMSAPDRRRRGLDDLRKAAELNPGPQLLTKLRDEAIEILALRDVEARRTIRTGPAWGPVFSSDGGWIATLDADGARITLHDPTGAQADREIALRPDAGSRAAAQRRGSGAQRFRWGPALAALGDGLVVAEPGGRGLRLVSLDGKSSVELPLEGHYVEGVLAAAGDRMITIEQVVPTEALTRPDLPPAIEVRFLLWDPATIQSGPIATLAQTRIGLRGTSWLGPKIAIAPGGKLIAVAENSMAPSSSLGTQADSVAVIRIHDAATGSVLAVIDKIEGGVTALAIGSDGQVAAAIHNGTIRLWDETQSLKPGFYHDIMMFGSLRFNSSGTLLAVAGGNSPSIQLYDPATNSLVATVRTPSRVSDVQFSPDGSLIAANSGDTTTLWAIAEPLGMVERGDTPAMTLAFAGDGRIAIAGGLDTPVRLWRPASCPEALTRVGTVRTPFVSSDDHDRLVTVSFEALERWPAADPRALERVEFPPPTGWAGTFDPNPRRLSTPISGRGLLAGLAVVSQALSIEPVAVTLAPEPLRRTMNMPGRALYGRVVGRSADGAILLLQRADELYLWQSINHDRLLRILPARNRDGRERPLLFGEPRMAVVTPDLTRLFLLERDRGSITRLTAWALEFEGDTIRASSMPWPRTFVQPSYIALAPDGATLALGGRDGVVRLVDAFDGRLERVLPSENREADGEVTGLAFNHDGLLAVGTQHGRIAIWDISGARQPRLLMHLPGRDDRVHSLAFDPNGQVLANIRGNEMVQVWDLNAVRTRLDELGLGW